MPSTCLTPPSNHTAEIGARVRVSRQTSESLPGLKHSQAVRHASRLFDQLIDGRHACVRGIHRGPRPVPARREYYTAILSRQISIVTRRSGIFMSPSTASPPSSLGPGSDRPPAWPVNDRNQTGQTELSLLEWRFTICLRLRQELLQVIVIRRYVVINACWSGRYLHCGR